MAQRNERPQQILAAVRDQVVVRIHPQGILKPVHEAAGLHMQAEGT